MTRFLSLDDLVVLCEELGGLVVRDAGLLDSAAHRPQTTVLGEDAYPELHTKAAVLLESLALNHPLVDGNKRLSWVAMVVFLGLNGFDLHAPEDDAYDLVIAVCTHDLDYHQVAELLRSWSRSTPS